MIGSWSSHLVDLVWAYFGVPDKLLSMYSIKELILWPQVLPVSTFLLRLEHFCSKSLVLLCRDLLFFFLFLIPKEEKKTVTCHGPSCGSDKQTKFADPRVASLPFSADYTVAQSLWNESEQLPSPRPQLPAGRVRVRSRRLPPVKGRRLGFTCEGSGSLRRVSAGNDEDSAAAFWKRKKMVMSWKRTICLQKKLVFSARLLKAQEGGLDVWIDKGVDHLIWLPGRVWRVKAPLKSTLNVPNSVSPFFFCLSSFAMGIFWVFCAYLRFNISAGDWATHGYANTTTARLCFWLHWSGCKAVERSEGGGMYRHCGVSLLFSFSRSCDDRLVYRRSLHFDLRWDGHSWFFFMWGMLLHFPNFS